MYYANKVHIFTQIVYLLTRKTMHKSSSRKLLCTKSHSGDEPSFTAAKEKLKNIFLTAVNSVKPQKIIESRVKIDENKLFIDNNVFTTIGEKIYLVGFGKAVMGMAMEMEKLLGTTLIKGLVSIPRGMKSKMQENLDNDDFGTMSKVVDYRENSWNNEADNDTLMITNEIVNLVESLSNGDTLIVLISGGGSALCSMPCSLITLEDKLNICRNLFNSGADIKEVNLIRQKLSMVKAGRLAKIAYPAQVIGLILSDIIGDPIELIASGPTVYSPLEPQVIEKILKKYNLYNKIADKVKTTLLAAELNDKERLIVDEINSKDQYTHVKNVIIGNNSLAIESACIESHCQGLIPIVLCNNIEGLVSEISLMYCKLCRLTCNLWKKMISEEEFKDGIINSQELCWVNEKANEICQVLRVTENQGVVLIAGGEPRVVVRGHGKGGRNQELALTFSLDWHQAVMNNSMLETFDVLFLSAGTDGQDGPTDASGAFGYSEINSTSIDSQVSENNNQVNESVGCNNTYVNDMAENMSLENALKNNDSYNFYSRFNGGRDLIKTGFTGTNVMDLHFIYIRKRPDKH